MKEQKFHHHSREQIKYFSQKIKHTMVPKTTPYLLRHIDALIRFTGIRTGDRVLEIGCGMGRYTLNMAERGINIEGLDLTQFLLNRFREYNNGRYNIPLYCGDVINLREDLMERFDAVIGFFTLHHLHDIPASFKAMIKLVRPGGTIAFLEPNAFNPLFYLQMLITPGMTWKGDKGITKMRKYLVFNAMREAGLMNIKLARFGFCPPFIFNLSLGAKLEMFLERVPIWRPFLPFQIFKGTRPG